VVNLGTAGDDQFRVSPSLKVPPSTPNSHAKQIATMLGEKTSQEDAKKQLLLHRAVVRVAHNATQCGTAAAVLERPCLTATPSASVAQCTVVV
jgi:hypothetical protein